MSDEELKALTDQQLIDAEKQLQEDLYTLRQSVLETDNSPIRKNIARIQTERRRRISNAIKD